MAEFWTIFLIAVDDAMILEALIIKIPLGLEPTVSKLFPCKGLRCCCRNSMFAQQH